MRRNSRYVDVFDAVDLRLRTVTFDGMHLTREANGTVAVKLAPLLREMMRKSRDSTWHNPCVCRIYGKCPGPGRCMV